MEQAEIDILDIIKKEGELTITDIYERLKNKYSWPTVSKYVNSLEIKGMVVVKSIGTAKLISIK